MSNTFRFYRTANNAEEENSISLDRIFIKYLFVICTYPLNTTITHKFRKLYAQYEYVLVISSFILLTNPSNL